LGTNCQAPPDFVPVPKKDSANIKLLGSVIMIDSDDFALWETTSASLEKDWLQYVNVQGYAMDAPSGAEPINSAQDLKRMLEA